MAGQRKGTGANITVEYLRKNGELLIPLTPTDKPDVYRLGGITVEVTTDEEGRLVLRVRPARAFMAHVQRAVQEDGMVWYGVVSSMIRAVGNDADARILDVAFHRTGVYRYFDVPPKVVGGLLNAESKGSYMRAHIIDEYPWEKLR